MNEFVIHACEQALRFTSVPNWDSLSEQRKVQLAFNLGVMSLGLDLPKEAGYDPLATTCTGDISIQALHAHIRELVQDHEVPVQEKNIAKEI